MRIHHGLAMTVLLLAATPSAADEWKDESGKGYAPYGHHDGEWKQEWRHGPCKYERKWESSGEYKEETKCDGHYDAPPAGPAAFLPVPIPPSITIVVPVD